MAGARNKIAIFLIAMIVFGGILLYFQGEKTTTVDASVQNTLCRQKISMKILGNDTETLSCPIASNSWFTVSLAASGNFSLTIETTYVSNGNQNYAGNQLLYSSSNANVSASFPVFVNSSSSTIQISNLQSRMISLGGNITVLAEEQSAVPVTFPVHPYWLLGATIIFTGLAFLVADIIVPEHLFLTRRQRKIN